MAEGLKGAGAAERVVFLMAAAVVDHSVAEVLAEEEEVRRQ